LRNLLRRVELVAAPLAVLAACWPTGVARAVVSHAYDNADRETTLTLPSTVKQISVYDSADRPSSITYKRGSTTLGALSYDYDRASKPYATWGSYARTGLPTAVSSASYDDANELTSWGGQALSYDAAGNLTADGSNTYSWNARGQLASIAGATSASFGYDAFARRQSATFAGTTTSFLYDGQNVVQELQSGAPTANLLTGLGTDESYRRTDSAGARDLMTDRLGSTIALANSAGTVQTSYTYEPFGKVTQTGSANSNTFKYTGREQDASGLVNLRARYYSPSFQRFLSEDPIGLAGGDANLYAYVGSSPLAYTDRSGEVAQAAAACLVGAAFNYLAERLSGRKFSTSDAISGCAAGLAGFGLGKALGRLLPVAKGGIRGFLDNPKDWELVSAHAEKSRKGGVSVQEIFENARTGDRVVKHTATDASDRLLPGHPHPRPYYEPREGE
jgi:RHS repeat-associated protein